MLLKSCHEIEGGREADRLGGWLRASSSRPGNFCDCRAKYVMMVSCETKGK